MPVFLAQLHRVEDIVGMHLQVVVSIDFLLKETHLEDKKNHLKQTSQ